VQNTESWQNTSEITAENLQIKLRLAVYWVHISITCVTCTQCTSTGKHYNELNITGISTGITDIYQSLSGNAPGYLADDCPLVAAARVRQLHSADTRTLVVSWIRSSFGDMTFAATRTLVWNSLQPNLRLRAVIRPVQAVTPDIFIRIVRPRCSANCFQLRWRDSFSRYNQ